LAPTDSTARWYAEWVWAYGTSERGDVVAGPRGFIVDGADDRFELTNFETDPAGFVISFDECPLDPELPCASTNLIQLDTNECPPADGCPTLQSPGGILAYHRASILMHPPRHVLIYEIVQGPQPVASIDEPTHQVRFVPGKPYFMPVYEEEPGQTTFQTLTVRYQDGSSDRIELAFNAEDTTEPTTVP
jgi:hypothetical protein